MPEIADDALRASELRYRRLFEAARDGILILDAGTGCINDVNPYLFKLLGFDREDMIGKTVGELSPFKDIESNERMLARVQEHGYVRYDDLPLETKDGRKIAVEFVSNAYEVGHDRVIQCNVRDITERKDLEARLNVLHEELEARVADRTAQLQAAHDELDAFSYSVSHDLRAPLRHVMGFIELLQKDAGAALSEKSLRYLRTIADAATRMGHLIDDLLAFSRNGRAAMQRTNVSLNRLVKDIVDEARPDLAGRDIVWTVADLPQVWADRALLRLALTNLISNAVKFTSTRAHATIDIGCTGGGADEAVLFIRDNGAGFDPRYADKLFGVFQRLHNRDEFEGTGIGLANVQRIIRRHGGRAWAEGAVEGGATFYASLPAHHGEQQ